MILAWTGDLEACARTARRLKLVPEEVVLAAEATPPEWWWLTPPAGLHAVIANLCRGDRLLVAHHPMCGAPLVVAAVELAAIGRGVEVTIFPRPPRWKLDPLRLAVRQARPSEWEEIAAALHRAGRSVRAIAAELQRRHKAGELHDSPSRATVGRLLRGRRANM